MALNDSGRFRRRVAIPASRSNKIESVIVLLHSRTFVTAWKNSSPGSIGRLGRTFCRKLRRMDPNTAARLQHVSGKQTLRLTHYGRTTGQPHEVTIWFVFDGERMYLATANVNRQWIKNVMKTPRVHFTIRGEKFDGEVRFINDSAERNRVLKKFQSKYWMYTPAFVIGRIAQMLGIVRNTMGAFEVKL
ncbi:MAG TPA: nitroreductase family deazaflavin-dependent oxidoreductase [Terriglobales bacterium]|nr:nitroreductase family deazaflavin-dependent oxidoreductase [Terriglobales bacterium]